jgi:hypothetical protein
MKPLARVRGVRKRLSRAAAAFAATPGSLPPAEEDRVRILAEKVAPLRLAVRESVRRVNLLVPTIDLRYVFGGYIAKLNLARRLSEAGLRVRVVIVDGCDFRPALWRRELEAFEGLAGLLDRVELAYAFDRRVPLSVSRDDAFVATTWWTAHVARRAVADLGRERFVYLIQEYEPFTFPMGAFAAAAEQSYRFPHHALFSTDFLRDWFRDRGLGVYADGPSQGDRLSTFFQNAVTSAGPVVAADIQARSPRRLLFYARPEEHAARNMFELGVLALREAVARGAFGSGWELAGIGTVGRRERMDLGRGRSLRFVPRTSQQGYRRVLRAHDLGLGLMYTPHPSLVPIEMAAAGMLVVTNTFANKTGPRLHAISSNLLAVEPTLEGVVTGLLDAAAAVEDVCRRAAGSHVAWSTDWERSLNHDVLERVLRFLDDESAAASAPRMAYPGTTEERDRAAPLAAAAPPRGGG